MYLQDIPTAHQINQAEQRIRPYVHRTPIFSSERINELAGFKLYFKCENLQKGGSFKIRGAMNALLSMSKDELKKGVATHSSGNHAQALAIAAREMKVPAWIIMPENSPSVKVNAVKSYGAKVIFCPATLKDRESYLEDTLKETGASFVPPYNSYDIIAGQATMMKEFLEDTEGIDSMVIPIGGGGLISGSILSCEYFGSHIHVYGAEPSGADDAYRSLLSGSIEPMENPQTIADGLKTSLGTLTFPLIQKGVEDIILVSELEIIESMKLIYQYLKLVIEPSAAVPLAAALKSKDQLLNKKVGLVLCGGNVDLEKLPF